MSDQTERLIVDVDASGVNAAEKSLDDFVTTAGAAGAAADKLGDRFDQTGADARGAAEGIDETNRSLGQTGEQAGDAATGLYRLQGLLDRIKPTRTTLRDIEQQQRALNDAQKAGLISNADAAEYNAILQNRIAVTRNAELALRGLNTASVKQKELQQGLTITTGQYRAAMGMLPAQMTDIVTQLAGGQNPFLIMIQQGGQIKDSFGGLKNTFTALKQFINPGFLGIAAVTAAVGGMGYAAYKSGEQVDRMVSSLVMMGDQGFKTGQQLNEAAERVAAATNSSISSVVDTLIDLNNQGTATPAVMERIARASIKMADAGRDNEQTMSDFNGLLKDPIANLAKLNDKYGIVTEAQFKHLIALKKEKGEQAASTAAVNIFADAMEKRADKTIEATDNIGQAWKWLKTGASNTFRDIGITLRAWGNQALDIFKLVTLSVDDLINNLASIDAKFTRGVSNLISKTGVDGDSVLRAMGIDMTDVDKRGREAVAKGEAIAKQFNAIKDKITDPNAQVKYEAEARNAVGASASESTDMKSRDAVNKLAEDQKKHNKEKAVSVSQGDKILEQYQQQALALQAQIRMMGQRNAFDQNASQERKDYLLLESKIAVLEGIQADAKGRKLTKDEQSLLANKSAVLAESAKVAKLGDQLQLMQKQAQISDELKRSSNDMQTQIDVITASWGRSADETERMLQNAQRAAALKDKGATQIQIDDDLAQRNKLQQAQEAKTQDWVGGARSALEEWGKDASNVSDMVKGGITGAMDAGLEAMNSFVMTGKASFADFTKSILSMIVQMINKWLIFKAIQGIGGAMGFDMSFMSAAPTANAKGGVYDSPSLSKYSGGVYDTPQFFSFAGAQKFAKGGVFAEAGPEAIMPLAKDGAGRLGVRAQGGGGGNQTSIGDVNVTVMDGKATTSTQGGDALGRAYGNVINTAIQDGITKACQPGGQIWVLQSGHA
nr:tail length tape measure protein [Klebsiella phage vB_Ko_K70PH128C1]